MAKRRGKHLRLPTAVRSMHAGNLPSGPRTRVCDKHAGFARYRLTDRREAAMKSGLPLALVAQ